ncbi:type 11 methyltransferase [Alsobacter metallidurans]|uniref:Type 11 methyltransferase n=1 Tax=Alsobacter metallidurans TaxID=340221 RepID=A0A917IBP1_9HYPH|nr:class I SAM-dependent methyltransferase [Alsobacter metallidurans]GGH32641.1 type 11 methyltransferase [Alsobacter metallidurans]
MADASAPIASALARATAAGCPPHLGLMHLLMAAPSEAAARDALRDAVAAQPDEAARTRLAAVERCWAERPHAWSTIHDVLAQARHDAHALSPQAAVAEWAGVFDSLAASAPDAGVALYGLGDPALTAQVSRELVDALQRWGALRANAIVLDFGCGVGRLSALIAPRCRRLLGLDVSAGMVAEARRRCAALPNAAFAQANGRDLEGVANASIDLALAVDVFPYLVQAGGDLAPRMVDELARTLAPGGRLVLANLSYRGDDARDAHDLAAWATAAGLTLDGEPDRPFTLWDGLVFRLRKA